MTNQAPQYNQAKVRKNNTKKVAAYLEQAKEITIETMCLGFDVKNEGGDSVLTVEQFKAWFSERYAKIEIIEKRIGEKAFSVLFRDNASVTTEEVTIEL